MAASLHCAKANSTACSFIMLASRASHSAAAQTLYPLDFLAPRATSCAHQSLGHPRWSTDCHRSLGHKIITSRWSAECHRSFGQKITSSRWAAADSRHKTISSSLCTDSRLVAHTLSSKYSMLGQPTYKRHFASSVSLRATRCILNPQHDDDGNELMLEITPRAAKRLSEIMKKDNNPNLALRIQVESGGCHGFQYLMSLTTLPPSTQDASTPTPTSDASTPTPTSDASTSTPTSDASSPTSTQNTSPPPPTQNTSPLTPTQNTSTPVNQDDSIFQYFSDDVPVPNGPKIILDEPSLDLLKGSKVDFTQELIGSQFKVVDNPLATSSCGCGTSFDIKM